MGGGIDNLKLQRAHKILRAPLPLSSRMVLNALGLNEKNVTEIEIDSGLPQSHTSLALARLHNAGYLHKRKEGLYVLYRINPDMIQKINRIARLLNRKPERIPETT